MSLLYFVFRLALFFFFLIVNIPVENMLYAYIDTTAHQIYVNFCFNKGPVHHQSFFKLLS